MKIHECTERVWRDYHTTNCSRTAKYDHDESGKPTKCGHHSKAAKQRKRDKIKHEDRLRLAEKTRRDAERKQQQAKALQVLGHLTKDQVRALYDTTRFDLERIMRNILESDSA